MKSLILTIVCLGSLTASADTLTPADMNELSQALMSDSVDVAYYRKEFTHIAKVTDISVSKAGDTKTFLLHGEMYQNCGLADLVVTAKLTQTAWGPVVEYGASISRQVTNPTAYCDN